MRINDRCKKIEFEKTRKIIEFNVLKLERDMVIFKMPTGFFLRT